MNDLSQLTSPVLELMVVEIPESKSSASAAASASASASDDEATKKRPQPEEDSGDDDEDQAKPRKHRHHNHHHLHEEQSDAPVWGSPESNPLKHKRGRSQTTTPRQPIPTLATLEDHDFMEPDVDGNVEASRSRADAMRMLPQRIFYQQMMQSSGMNLFGQNHQRKESSKRASA